MTKIEDLVEAVKTHAAEHYEDGGWDVIVETLDDNDIAEILRGERNPGYRPSRSVKGAIARVGALAALYREADAPHRAEREAGREEDARERRNRLARERRAAAKAVA
jgi:hypothetical protein